MSTVTLSQPQPAITSARSPKVSASQPFTQALPASRRALSLFAIERIPVVKEGRTLGSGPIQVNLAAPLPVCPCCTPLGTQAHKKRCGAPGKRPHSDDDRRKPVPPNPEGFLTGQLLIAMPAMADHAFPKA